MAKYKVRETYPVEVKNPKTGQIEVEQRPYDLEKYHGDKKLEVGDVVDLTADQLKIHGEKYFDEYVEEAEPATEALEEATDESETIAEPDPVVTRTR